jgi:hypothetical protein
MPIVLPSRIRRRLAYGAALTVVMALVIPATAFAASCPVQATTTPFTKWGDTGSYFPLPGGNFETPLTASGWIVNGAARTIGNEPFYVGSSSDSHSLTIGDGGFAVSPAFCLDDSMPYFRFFSRALGARGNLELRLLVQNGTRSISTPLSHVADLSAGAMTTWAPTVQLNLAGGMIVTNGQSALGRLVFDVAGRGNWQVDDIYVDPYRSR